MCQAIHVRLGKLAKSLTVLLESVVPSASIQAKQPAVVALSETSDQVHWLLFGCRLCGQCSSPLQHTAMETQTPALLCPVTFQRLLLTQPAGYSGAE